MSLKDIEDYTTIIMVRPTRLGSSPHWLWDFPIWCLIYPLRICTFLFFFGLPEHTSFGQLFQTLSFHTIHLYSLKRISEALQLLTQLFMWFWSFTKNQLRLTMTSLSIYLSTYLSIYISLSLSHTHTHTKFNMITQSWI